MTEETQRTPTTYAFERPWYVEATNYEVRAYDSNHHHMVGLLHDYNTDRSRQLIEEIVEAVNSHAALQRIAAAAAWFARPYDTEPAWELTDPETTRKILEEGQREHDEHRAELIAALAAPPPLTDHPSSA